MKQITYAVEKETGLVISRVGSELCIPVMDFEGIGKGGDYTKPIEYTPQKFPLSALNWTYQNYRWTKKIPIEIKNLHREFWGFKPLKGEAA
jgi:hypothetical protein